LYSSSYVQWPTKTLNFLSAGSGFGAGACACKAVAKQKAKTNSRTLIRRMITLLENEVAIFFALWGRLRHGGPAPSGLSP
jgi:hypothetical protein